jgi:outer membrane biosynthesis protein TonB
MRSSVILGALCALGAMAEIEPAYVTTWTTTTVTDWTVVTITKTITVQPTTEATVEPTSAPATEVKVQEPEPEPVEVESTTTTTQAPAPVETSWSSTWTATQEPETTTTTTTTSQATQAPAPTTNTYQGNVLYSHNVHRANHSSTDLTWSSDLEASAQALAASCVYQHNDPIEASTAADTARTSATVSLLMRLLS